MTNQSVGYLHICTRPERNHLLDDYIENIDEIVNHPDYIFEDKYRENTVLIAKQVADFYAMLVVTLNFNRQKRTNTLVTMWPVSIDEFVREKNRFRKFAKTLYIKRCISV